MEKRFEIGDRVQIVGKADGYDMNRLPWEIGDFGYIVYVSGYTHREWGQNVYLERELGDQAKGICGDGSFFFVDLIKVDIDGQLSLPLKWR